MVEKRLVRSQDDRMCCGVAGGVAGYINVDSTLVRLFFVLTTIFCNGLGLLLYVILWLLMPEGKLAEKAEAA